MERVSKSLKRNVTSPRWTGQHDEVQFDQKAAAAPVPHRTKVFVISGQDTTVDDLAPRPPPPSEELGFSKHQRRKYKPPRSFKAATTDETNAVVLTSSDKPGQDEASKAAETKTKIADFAAAQKDWDKPQEATNKAEQKETETENAKQKQEEVLPNPSTFAKQLETSVIHRLMEAGHPIYADSELASARPSWRVFQQAVLSRQDRVHPGSRLIQCHG